MSGYKKDEEGGGVGSFFQDKTVSRRFSALAPRLRTRPTRDRDLRLPAKESLSHLC